MDDMDLTEQLSKALRELRDLQNENQKLRDIHNRPTKPTKIPTKILKIALNAFQEIIENADRVEWSRVSEEDKKKLAVITANELKANGMRVPDVDSICQSLRSYYNSKRKTLKINSSKENRRLHRKRTKLAVMNHRIRNDAVKKAIREKKLNATDTVAVKTFRKQVPLKSIRDIETPPASDDEEGKLKEQEKKMAALQFGSRKRMDLYASIREEINNNQTQSSQSSDDDSSEQVSGSEGRAWLTVPGYGTWPWDTMPTLSFDMITEVLNQGSFVANFKDCTAADLKKLIPGSPLNSKIMYTLTESAVACINQGKPAYEHAQALMPINIKSIVATSRGGFAIADDLLAKRIKEIGTETQFHLQRRCLVMPVVKSMARGGIKVNYWTMTVAVVSSGKKRLVFLNPLGDKGDVDAKKMCYFFDQILNVGGSWDAMTNSTLECRVKAKFPTVEVPSDTGVLSFLYALKVPQLSTLPEKLDITDIRLWILNVILKESDFDQHFMHVTGSDDDDDETQYSQGQTDA